MKTRLLYLFFLISASLFAQWQEVNITGFSNDAGGSINRIAIDNNSNIYIAYRHNSFKLDVIKFNGTSWSYLGAPEITSHQIKSNLDIKTDNNNIPYVVYTDNVANSQKLTVIKFNGTSWEHIGNPGMGFYAKEQDLFIDKDDNLYLSYTETTKNEIRVHRFDGNSWTQLSTAIDIGNYSSIIKDINNDVYVVYAGSNYLDVKKISDSIALSTNNFTELDNRVDIYPNPATSNITISLSDDKTIQKVEVYSILGDKIITQNGLNTSKINVDVSNLSAGIYFIKAKADHKILSKKLIIK